MAKHRRREQEPVRNNNNNTNNNINNNPFGIDPMQLMNLLGGNFDMNSMLKSMNTNGFNLANLEPLAKMAGINLGSNGMFNNMNQSPNMNGNMNTNNGMNNMNNGFNSDVNGTNDNMNRDNEMMQDSGVTDINQMSDVVDIDKQKSDKNRRGSSKKESSKKQERIVMDENLKFLITLKTYIHPDRAEFIDKIIESYNKGMFK